MDQQRRHMACSGRHGRSCPKGVYRRSMRPDATEPLQPPSDDMSAKQGPKSLFLRQRPMTASDVAGRQDEAARDGSWDGTLARTVQPARQEWMLGRCEYMDCVCCTFRACSLAVSSEQRGALLMPNGTAETGRAAPALGYRYMFRRFQCLRRDC